jgi:hypothetical protein
MWRGGEIWLFVISYVAIRVSLGFVPAKERKNHKEMDKFGEHLCLANGCFLNVDSC